MTTTIIIDTDIGDDIDDALAVAFALGSPEFDIAGITTVYGDVVTRAAIARRLCVVSGRADIPVIAGESFPLAGGYHPEAAPAECSQRDAVSEPLSDPAGKTSPSAVRFIIDTIQRHAGHIHIITIGAMTNIAAALDREPSLADAISGIVSLAGFMPPRLGQPEWNMRYDPDAAKRISTSGVNWTVIGADAAKNIRLGRAELDAVAAKKTPASTFLKELILLWARNKSGWDAPHIFDVPGAHTADVATLFSFLVPDVFEFKTGIVEVAGNGALSFAQDDDLGMHRIATQAIPADYLPDLIRRILG